MYIHISAQNDKYLYECDGSPPWSHTDNSCSDPFTAGTYLFIAIRL